jgi:GTP-binding protein YchF
MSLQCGIFGLPNVGKSTCLNALSQVIIATASNYPFCTINPNRSKVPVPDARLVDLANIVQTERTVPTTVEFVDIAGLVAGASKGEGLGNQFLSHIREVDALVHVVRCFEDPEIIHVSGEVHPLNDIETIETELILSDMERVEKLIKNQSKQVKAGDKTAKLAEALLLKVKEYLDQGRLLRKIEWQPEEYKQLKLWQFLTLKPMLYLANVSEDGFQNNPLLEAVQTKAKEENTQLIVSCIKLEADLIGASEEEKRDLLTLVGGQNSGLSQLIRAAYQLLGLQTFFTAGPKEVHAWTIPVGATAIEAAGCIHTDFQKKFIAAEVIAYDDFITCQGSKGAKAAGKWRIEKRDYTVQDGDIIIFRANENANSSK